MTLRGEILALKNILNYTAKHNEIGNRHRQAALQTFDALVEAADSHQAKDVILQHAANAIFQHRDSGYLKNQSNENIAPMIKSVESLTKASGNLTKLNS